MLHEVVYPHEFDFAPKTYNLPAQHEEFLEEFRTVDDAKKSRVPAKRKAKDAGDA